MLSRISEFIYTGSWNKPKPPKGLRKTVKDDTYITSNLFYLIERQTRRVGGLD